MNLQDLIITKIFRGTRVDVVGCVAAFAAYDINPEELLKRYAEAANYDFNPKKMIQNFIIFTEALLEKGKAPDDFLNKVAAH